MYKYLFSVSVDCENGLAAKRLSSHYDFPDDCRVRTKHIRYMHKIW